MASMRRLRPRRRWAGIEPETIRYVEAHGTGTALGDPIEVAALTKAFRTGTEAKQFCALGAVKGNFGHLEAAAGVAGLLKATLAVYHGEIPPTLHFDKPNPRIDFTNTPFYVASKLEPWPAQITPRRAGVSSFGVGGTNAHLVLEQAPPATIPEHKHLPQVLVLSAKTAPALEAATQRLKEHLEKHPQAELEDVAQTLQLGRRAFNHRRSLVAKTPADAVASLAAKSSASDTQGRTPPVAFLFPGQGSQQAGMGRELYATNEIFRDEVDRCCEILKPELKLDLRGHSFPEGDDARHRGEADTNIADAAGAFRHRIRAGASVARAWRKAADHGRAQPGRICRSRACRCFRVARCTAFARRAWSTHAIAAARPHAGGWIVGG